jgi:hypothetical protein
MDNGRKTKRHKARAKTPCSKTHYKKRLTVLCPTACDAVGQFCILQLSAISYQLSAISYQLSAISYQLSAISYQLLAFKIS